MGNLDNRRYIRPVVLVDGIFDHHHDWGSSKVKLPVYMQIGGSDAGNIGTLIVDAKKKEVRGVCYNLDVVLNEDFKKALAQVCRNLADQLDP